MELLQRHFDTALESPNGIKKLRELILTLAMQGKLVKQDPRDQPASVLLKEIHAEKERLIKEGKIRKQKELPPIKPEEVLYQVPEGWEWVRLGDLFKVTSGTNLTKEKMIEGNIPVYGGNGVTGYHNEYNIEKPTIVIGRVGFYCGSIHLTPIKAWVTDNAFITIYDEQRLFQSFVIWLFKTINLQIDTSATAQPVISGSKIYPILIPLPPLAEQKRIVAKIDELMALCDKLETQRNARDDKRLAVHAAAINRLLTAADTNDFDSAWQFITRHFDPLYSVKENVAELKKAILTLAMQGKLVKQDPKDQPASELLKEIQAEKERLVKEGKIKKQKELPPIKPEEVPYEVPSGWVWTRLGEIGETQTGTTPATKDADNFGDYIPFIGPGDILNQAIVYNNNGLSEKGINYSRIIQKSSILMVCIGGSIGKHAINTVDVACNQQINTITPFSCDVKFLFYSMWTDDFQNNVITNAGGSATPIINKHKWSMILVPLPPLAEQKRIVAKIDELMVLCDNLENQIDKATAKQTALFDAVLAKV